MTAPTPRTRGEELLLARISAAAGRAHLGRRLATYTATVLRGPAQGGPVRAIRLLPALARYGRSSAPKVCANARLDLYESGMTVAVKGRIHVVRYDATAVFQNSARPRGISALVGTSCTYTLTDVERKRIVLYRRPEDGEAAKWGPAIQRAIAHAQLPRAWAALRKGEHLAFGDIWLTAEKVGWGEFSVPWPQVQQLAMKNGAITLTIHGKHHTLTPTGSKIPNLYLFSALAERLRTEALQE
ncbi:DUF6585 family protein [Streptomyces yunnanensis]|uniref:Uncharacterized protein n=1 Tax=Streptomyces yunnanensis TaxID=156453 RepID=A0A9X8MZP3_9ACTN|nr:DUF6585 family protein [Streptomyces yunnanensis]SHM45707.1 hypothetical protein SAMN05216268_11177 [Streptomyces yunnanensis]